MERRTEPPQNLPETTDPSTPEGQARIRQRLQDMEEERRQGVALALRIAAVESDD